MMGREDESPAEEEGGLLSWIDTRMISGRIRSTGA